MCNTSNQSLERRRCDFTCRPLLRESALAGGVDWSTAPLWDSRSPSSDGDEDGNPSFAQSEIVTDVNSHVSQPGFSFRPITGPRAFEEVVDQITHAVRSGAFPPGSRLPRINDLSREMRVSRPSVMQAGRLLNDAGGITIR